MSLTYANAHAQTKSLPRTVAVVAVVLLHLAMFYALTVGRGTITILKPIKDSVAVFIPLETPHTTPPKIAMPKTAQLETTPTPQEPVIAPEVPMVENSDTTAITTDSVPTDQATPSVANSVAIIHRVEPPYPGASRRAGEHGTVLLEIVIGQDGRPLEVTIAKSSGYPALDESAVSTVRKWRFSTNVNAGQARVTMPVTFRLNDRAAS